MLWLSCEGQIDVWELFSDNSHLSAAPVDLRTKKADASHHRHLQGFWSKIKVKNPKIVVMPPTVFTKYINQKESYGNSTVCASPL